MKDKVVKLQKQRFSSQQQFFNNIASYVKHSVIKSNWNYCFSSETSVLPIVLENKLCVF